MSKPYTFFTSDTHFGHANIIKHCKRPFKTVAEMDTSLITRWNYCARDNDIVYHLGDFTLKGQEEARYLFGQLNGRIRMLSYPWHHDKNWIRQLSKDPPESKTGHPVLFLGPMVVLKITAGGVKVPITLCHYPLHTWEQMHRGAVMLYGHSHRDEKLGQRGIHVGVDTNSFRPVSLNKIINLLVKTPYVSPYDNAPPMDSKPVKNREELMYL